MGVTANMPSHKFLVKLFRRRFRLFSRYPWSFMRLCIGSHRLRPSIRLSGSSKSLSRSFATAQSSRCKLSIITEYYRIGLFLRDIVMSRIMLPHFKTSFSRIPSCIEQDLIRWKIPRCSVAKGKSYATMHCILVLIGEHPEFGFQSTLVERKINDCSSLHSLASNIP